MKKINSEYFLLATLIMFAGCFSGTESQKITQEITQEKVLDNEIQVTVEVNGQEFSSGRFSYDINRVAGYDSVKVEGFETLQVNEKPMIPYREIEIDVPLDAKVTVDAVLGDAISFSGMNVPAFVSPPVMPDEEWGDLFADVSDELGVFPVESFYYLKVDFSGDSVVKVFVYPFSYDASNDELLLNKNILLKISYDSVKNGIVKNFKLEDNSFEAGTEMETFTTIKNTAKSDKDFKVNLRIEDLSGNVMESKAQSFKLNGWEEGEFPVKIKTPLEIGDYSLVMTAIENGQEIGLVIEHIKVIPKQNVIIKDLTVSGQLSKSDKNNVYAVFDLKLENPTKEAFRAYVDLYISKGSGVIAKRPQMFVDLDSGETKKVTDTWFVNDLEPGFYSVQAVAYIDKEYKVTSLESFEIVK